MAKEPQTVAAQKYVPEPKLGELLVLASATSLSPVVLASFNRYGNWQVIHINGWRHKKRGIPAHHDTRLARLSIESLSAEEKADYEVILKKLTK